MSMIYLSYRNGYAIFIFVIVLLTHKLSMFFFVETVTEMTTEDFTDGSENTPSATTGQPTPQGGLPNTTAANIQTTPLLESRRKKRQASPSKIIHIYYKNTKYCGLKFYLVNIGTTSHTSYLNTSPNDYTFFTSLM